VVRIAVAGFAYLRDRLWEDRRHDGADLLDLLLRGARTLTLLMAATVISTASLIRSSTDSSAWDARVCSAISCMRRWNSGSSNIFAETFHGRTVVV
jgi:hypothetical protein